MKLSALVLGGAMLFYGTAVPLPLRVVRDAHSKAPAETTPTEVAPGEPAPPTVPPTEGQVPAPRSDAAQAFITGEAAFMAEDFEAAVVAFKRAHELAPHAHTLFNLGVAQAKAGHTLDAWETFTRLVTEAVTGEEQTETFRHLTELRKQLAFLSVTGPPDTRLCLDGHPIAHDEMRLMLPGKYRLTTDGYARDLDLHGGESYVVDLQRLPTRIEAAPVLATDPPRHSRRVIPWAATAAAAAAGALGLAIGATTTSQGRSTVQGLAAGSAGLAGVATFAAIAAIITARREARRSEVIPQGTSRQASLGPAPARKRKGSSATAPCQ